MEDEFDLDFEDNVMEYNSGSVRRRKILLVIMLLALIAGIAVGSAVGGGFAGYYLATTSSTSSTSGSDSPSASASPSPVASPVGSALWQQLSLPGIVSHLEALQAIATENGGTRSITSPGFNASLEYVQKQLSDNTDYKLTVQPFTVNLTVTLSPPLLSMVAPDPVNFTSPTDFAVLQFSGSGDVTQKAVPAANLGCDPSDFNSSATSGKIALIARGNCSFAIKADNAIAAGAVGVLVYNSQDQKGSVQGTLGGVTSLPVFGITYELGQQFLMSPDDVFHMSYECELRTIYTANLIAETLTGDPDTVVTIGSHLDSVDAGPGLNDNGSGSSANLQMALQFGQVKDAVNKVRFLWYGAEEEGLLGSTFYVKSLTSEEKAKVALNLNFDMLGSPNFIRGILNGSDSDIPGSATIMSTFVEFFDANKLAYKVIPFNGRSDYGPYLAAGIPAGGVETGAEVIKTPEERLRFGGFANTPYDPCYHQSCDTIENVDTAVLLETAQAAAFALERFAALPNLRASFQQ